MSVAIGANGETLVLDQVNNRIARFSRDGTPLEPLPLTLRTPRDQVIRPARIGHLQVRFDGSARALYVGVSARTDKDERWHQVAQGSGRSVKLEWPREWLRSDAIVEELEIEFVFAPGAKGSHLTRMLLY